MPCNNKQRGISTDSQHFFTLDSENNTATLWCSPLSKNRTEGVRIENVVSAGFGDGGDFYIGTDLGKIQKWSVVNQPMCQAEVQKSTPQMVHASNKCVLFRNCRPDSGRGLLSEAESPAFMLPENSIHPESLHRLRNAAQVSFSGDGELVAWIAEGNIEIQRIDAADCSVHWTLVPNYVDSQPTTGELASVLLSPDGVRVAIAFGLVLYIGPTSTEKEYDEGRTELRLFPTGHGSDDYVVCAAFHPGGEYLALGCNTDTIILVNAKEMKEITRWKASHKTSNIIWSPCGKWLILGEGKVIEPLDVTDKLPASRGLSPGLPARASSPPPGANSPPPPSESDSIREDSSPDKVDASHQSFANSTFNIPRITVEECD